MPRPHAMLRAGFPYHKTIGRKKMTDFAVDLAFGKEGRIYLLSSAGGGSLRIVHFDDELLQYEADEAPNGYSGISLGEDGEDCLPTQVIADGDENCYVTDELLHNVTVVDRRGDIVNRWGKHGSGDGEIDAPSGLAFDLEGNIYISDTMNHRIQKFTRDGRFIQRWGEYGSGDGQLNMPWGVAVDDDGDVYVSDWRNDRVQKFSPDGDFILGFGRSGSGDGEFNRPAGIAVDADFDIYVCDRGNDRVQLFNPDGVYVQKFVGNATLSKSALQVLPNMLRNKRLREMSNLEQQEKFRSPRSVRVNDEGYMLVPDFGAYRIQVYRKEAYQLEEYEIAPELRAVTLSDN